MTKKDYSRSAREIFNEWSRDDHADGMEREHWPTVSQALSRIPEQAGKYLEVGVGNGYAIRYLATHQFARGQCFGLDISPEMAARAQKNNADLGNVSVESGDFLSWSPPPGDLFAVIFSMEVFYYFPNILQGLEKAMSLIQPGGMLMVLVNFYKENPTSHTWPNDLDTHMQLWSAEEYRAGFQKAGFMAIQQERFLDPRKGDVDSVNVGTLGTWGYKF
jgi:trans-aconitate methyltransferase